MRTALRSHATLAVLLLAAVVASAAEDAATSAPSTGGATTAPAADGAKPAGTFNWPNYRGPDYDGISKETDWSPSWPPTGPKELWAKKIGIGFGSIAVADGRAYAMGNTDDVDTVWCFDAATGEELWKHSYHCALEPKNHEGGPGSTPTVDGDRVYTVSKQGLALCLKTSNGDVVWQRDIARQDQAGKPTWAFATSALIVGDIAYYDLCSAGVALNKNTGQPVWKSAPGVCGYATPVPYMDGKKQCLAIFAKEGLIAVDAATGAKLWSLPWKTPNDVNAADPIIHEGKVFISSGYNRGGAVVKMGPQPQIVWENKNMRNHFNGCVLLDGYLYGFDESTLKCISFADGAEKWAEKGLGKGSLIAADGRLVVLSERGILVTAKASPEGFTPISRAKVLSGKCWTAPALAGGRVYCRNAAGDLVCLDVSGK
jgi:outer membrane protein assembly factor BamB